MRVKVPAGESGNVKIDKFTIGRNGMGTDATKDPIGFMSALKQLVDARNQNRTIRPGTYTRLIVDNETMMSDTPAELRDHKKFVESARGSVLVTGLGLGAILIDLLRKPEVEHITVVEKNEHVIKLVEPTYRADRLRVVHADAFEWQADRKFKWAWHDIWPTISDKNYPEMQKLKKHYYSIANTMCWCEIDCEAMWMVLNARDTGLTPAECRKMLKSQHKRVLRRLLAGHGIRCGTL